MNSLYENTKMLNKRVEQLASQKALPKPLRNYRENFLQFLIQEVEYYKNRVDKNRRNER